MKLKDNNEYIKQNINSNDFEIIELAKISFSQQAITKSMKNNKNKKIALSKSMIFMLDEGYNNIFNVIQYGHMFFTPHNRSLFVL